MKWLMQRSAGSLDKMTPEQKELKWLKDREYNQRKKVENKVKNERRRNRESCAESVFKSIDGKKRLWQIL